MEITFEYNLTGTGWAEMKLGTHENKVTIPVSYVCDPLTDLLSALLRLMKKQARFEIINLDGETDVHDLLLTEVEAGLIRVEVIQDAYFAIYDPVTDGSVPMPIFTAYAYKTVLAVTVKNCLSNLIAKIGIEKYNEQWAGHTFPEAELKELSALG